MIKKEYLLGGFVSRKITTRAMGKKKTECKPNLHDTFN